MKPIADPRHSAVRFWICWAAPAVTFALFAAASFLPERRLWGINHLAFYPQPVRLGVLVVTGLFLVPPLASATWRAFVWIVRPYFRGLRTGVNAIALSGMASFVAFAALRSATRLLGDGYYITNNFRNAAEQHLGIRGYFDLVTVHERIYPATEIFNYAASWAAGRLGASPAGGVWIANCAIGALVVVGLLAAVRRTDWPEGTKFAVCAVVLFSGAIELFFGYVEHYTPALALGALYVFVALRAAVGKVAMWKPGAVLLAAIVFHAQAILLLPSYVWLVAWAAAAGRGETRGRRIAAAVAVATVLAAVGLRMAPAAQRFYLPLAGSGPSGYGLLSSAHLLDVANELLLLCPLWLLLAALVLRGRGPTTERGRLGWSVPAGPFAWMLALPAGLFLFAFRPELGMARDWDLFAFTVLGLAAPGLVAFVRYVTRAEQTERTAAIVAPAVVLAAAMTFSWVGVNADAERSVARYRAILAYDRTNPGYAYETLARHFEDNFQYARQIEALRQAYDASGNPRYLHKLGRVYYESGDTGGAMKALRLFLAARPGDDDARLLLLPLLARAQLVDEMIHESLIGIQHSPRRPEYYFYLGNAYLAKGMTQEGLKAFDTCSRLNPPPEMVQEMKRLTDRVGKGRTNER